MRHDRARWYNEAMITIDQVITTAAPLCRDLGVKRLDVFGSLARGEARENSDLDLAVEFENPEHRPARRFFDLLHGLEDSIGCRIDLLTMDAVRNPYLQERIRKERVNVYGG